MAPSRPPCATVVALTGTSDERRIIADALRAAVHLVHARTVPDVLQHVVHRRTSAVVVALGRAPGSAADDVARLRAALPDMPIIGWGTLRPRVASEIVTLTRAGITDVAIAGHDDLRSVLTGALRDGGVDVIAREVLEHVGARLPERGRQQLAAVLSHARGPMSAEEIAARLEVPRRTLDDRLRRAGLPAPGPLLCWARLFHAAKLMEWDTQPVDAIALALGFASGAGLRGMLKRYTGLTPSEVRAGGGLACVCRAFARGCRGEEPPRAPAEPTPPGEEHAASRMGTVRGKLPVA